MVTPRIRYFVTLFSLAALLLSGCVQNSYAGLAAAAATATATATSEAYPAEPTNPPYPGEPTNPPTPGTATNTPRPNLTPSRTPTLGTPAAGNATRTPTRTATPAKSVTPGTPGTPTLTPQVTATFPFTTTPTERPITTAEPPPHDIQTLTIWHSWSPGETNNLNDVLSAFQKNYPNIRFDILYVPADSLQGKFESEAYQGKGPDILLGPAEWGPSFYDKHLVTDLTPYADPQFLSTINPAALGEGKYKGALIGLPHDIRAGVVLYRNTRLIAQPVTNWDDLLAHAKNATHGGEIGAYLERSVLFSGANLTSLGGSLMDANGSPAFNNQKGVNWLNLLKAYEQAGPAALGNNRDVDLFKMGRVALIFEYSWKMDELARAIGPQNLAIDPWPSYGSSRFSGYVQTDNLYLNANSPVQKRAAALRFMGFFLTKEVQTTLVRAGHIPAVLGVKSDNQLINQAVKAFEGGTPFPIQPQAPLYWDPLETAIKAFTDGSLSAQDALKQAEEAIRAKITGH